MKLLRRSLIIINGILIISLIFGLLRQFIYPGHASFLTFFSLLYPYIVIALIISLVLLALIRSPWLWVTLLTLLITSGNTIRQIGFHIHSNFPTDSSYYTLTTLNIKNNFRHNKQDQSTAFIQDFKDKKPTFLLLQEISDNQIHHVSNTLNYPYDSYQVNGSSEVFMGIFSQYPLSNIKSIQNTNGKVIALVADVILPEGKLRIFNIHLHTNAVTVRAGRFSAESFSKKEGLKALKDMLQSYNENAILRLAEIELINAEIDKSPYPVIVAGDANDTPYSSVYRKLKGDRQNAFVEGGLGFAQTYNALIIPLKIDYIFMGNSYSIHNTTINKISYSDHNPVTTSFSFQN